MKVKELQLYLIGINHKEAPIHIREKFSIVSSDVPQYLQLIRGAIGANEVVILSTCNRTEFYLAGLSRLPSTTKTNYLNNIKTKLLQILCQKMQLKIKTCRNLAKYFYIAKGVDVIKHLFEVTSGLDSQAIGETQILSQVKKAYYMAKENGATSRVFNILFQRALNTAKIVHTKTKIHSSQSSIPALAISLAKKTFKDFANKKVVVVGTGDTAKLVLQLLKENGLKDIRVVSKNAERAKTLAEHYGVSWAKDISSIKRNLFDIIISCTNYSMNKVSSDALPVSGRNIEVAPFVISKELFLKLIQGEESKETILLLDLGVPRNIEPEIGKIKNVLLYNIDDLKSAVGEDIIRQNNEINKAKRIIKHAVKTLLGDLKVYEAAETITILREKTRKIAEDELKRTLHHLNHITESDKEEIRLLVHRITNKFLHRPISALKELFKGSALRNQKSTRKSDLLKIIHKILGVC